MTNDNKWLQPALQVFAKLSGWIAFPVIIGAFLGKWLDKRYGTEPWLFLGVVGFSFIISMFGLVSNALKEFKKIEKQSKEEKENKEEQQNKEKK